MSIRSAWMDIIRRFAPRRTLEKRTYVFILAPFDFRGNGNAKKASVGQDLIDNGSHADSDRTEIIVRLTAPDSTAAKITPERDLTDELELNYDLMWTWFLPNPRWPLKKAK